MSKSRLPCWDPLGKSLEMMPVRVWSQIRAVKELIQRKSQSF